MMDGLHNRQRARVRLSYLKEQGGLCRVIELVLLGAVLGFLGLLPGSVTTTFHAVVTSLVLASVTVVFLAHLLQPHRRCCCCTSPRSWTIAETVHDVVGAGLLLPGALLLLLSPLNSPLTVAAVLTLMAQVVLGIQGGENFQKARGYTVPSRLATPVPIIPVHSRQRPSSRPPDGPVATAPPVNQVTAPRRVPTAQPLESNLGSGIWTRENYGTEATLSSPSGRAAAPALLESPAPPHGLEERPLPRATRWSRQNKTVTIQSPATSQSWSTHIHPLLSPGVNDEATASPGEAIVTLPLASPREVPPTRSPPAILVRQLTPSPGSVPNCPAPQRNRSTPSGLLMPPHEAAATAASPAVFVTPHQSPSTMYSSFCSSVYHTPVDSDVTATQPTASAGESASSVLSVSSDRQDPAGCAEPAGIVSTPTIPERKVRPTMFKIQ